MRRRILMLAGLVAVLAVSCGGSGPVAPLVMNPVRYCGANFCIEYPGDWDVVEATDDFLSLAHSAAPDEVLATIGQVNMEGIVNADGKPWPQTTDTVIKSFWALIDGGGAELATLSPQRDGSIESFGSFAGGRLWYRLSPLTGRNAIGVEVRAPNSTWGEHAETIMASLTVVDG